MPRHNFESKLDKQHNFESKIDNKHFFTSVINIAKYFTGIIDNGYFNSNYLKATFTNAINITVATAKYVMGFSASVVVDPIIFTVDRFLTNVKISPSVQFISNNIISAFPSITTKFGSTNLQVSQRFQAILSQLIKARTNALNVSQVSMNVSPTYRKYYYLSDWDASLLSTLDSKNLSEMDYQAV